MLIQPLRGLLQLAADLVLGEQIKYAGLDSAFLAHYRLRRWQVALASATENLPDTAGAPLRKTPIPQMFQNVSVCGWKLARINRRLTGFGQARHQAHSEGGPVAGTMDQVRPLMREQRSHDCASLDWPTGPHPTPSGSGLAPTADRSKTPAAGSRSRGIERDERPSSRCAFRGVRSD